MGEDEAALVVAVAATWVVATAPAPGGAPAPLSGFLVPAGVLPAPGPALAPLGANGPGLAWLLVTVLAICEEDGAVPGGFEASPAAAGPPPPMLLCLLLLLLLPGPGITPALFACAGAYPCGRKCWGRPWLKKSSVFFTRHHSLCPKSDEGSDCVVTNETHEYYGSKQVRRPRIRR